MLAENLAEYHNIIAFKCRNHKKVSLIYSTNTKHGTTHIEITLSLKKYSKNKLCGIISRLRITMMRSKID